MRRWTRPIDSSYPAAFAFARELTVAGIVAGIFAVLAAGACARSAATRPEPAHPSPDVDVRVARVSLGTFSSPALAATGAWRLSDEEGHVIARGGAGSGITLSSERGVLRAVDGGETPRTIGTSPLVMSADGQNAVLSVNGRRYRGALVILAADSGVQVVNRVAVEAYLRGVVPRELGVRNVSERAALEAQAVAARSYAVVRLGNASRAFDLVATTGDQVYGGVDAENALANAAIAATEGLVLYYGDRIVSAPYHSTCGGSTAEPAEVWRGRAEPFLQRVSDRVPGTDRYYCDVAPRFRWERSWRGDTLSAIVARYLRAYAAMPARDTSALGAVRGIEVEARTASGRVAAIRVETESGSYRVQANDIRYVLRAPGGELLNSTYFTPEVVMGPGGRLARLTVRGLGYGHGVGMCQWGAIGRARAGQNFRTILRTYFPGTTVARAY